MNSRSSLLRLLLPVVAALALASCAPDDTDGDRITDDKDKCPTEKGVKPDGCPVRKELGAVHFFLETSASMGGYFRGAAEFPAIVSDLSAKIDREIKPIDIFYIAETTQPFTGSPQAFSSAIATTKVSPQKSSQLHKIFADIAARTGENDVSVLVSDCILSFPDADIKANPEINKNAAQSTLKSNIYGTFSDLNKKKGFGASVYAFRSKFWGTYYDYQNKKKELKGEQRPFYVWAIGSKELLQKFNAQLATISSFRPEQHAHFGLADKPVTTFDVIPSVGRKGDWMEAADRGGVEGLGDAAKKPAQFCVGLDLSALPPYAQDVAYLQNNLKLEPKGCTATFTMLRKEDADVSKLRSEPQKAAFEKCTHAMMVQVNGMALKAATLTARMPLRSPAWYTGWSCMDDKALAGTCAGKTFAFEYLFTGVKEAYETGNGDYMAFTLNLKK